MEVCDGDAEFVDDGGVTRVARGVEFADEDGDKVAGRDAVGADLAPGLVVGRHGDDVPRVEALDDGQVLGDGGVPAVGGVEVREASSGGNRDGGNGRGGVEGGRVEDDGRR